MLFNSIPYLIFFPLVLLAYWLSPRAFRRPLLLIASYVFYMSWIPRYGLLILALTVVNYFLALAIEKFSASKRIVLIAGLTLNLATLCFYKYTNFLFASVFTAAQAVFPALGMPPPETPAAMNIILPLGISFFAFEFVHYLTDVYKGDRAIKNPIDFALFAAFFPSQIAGPIKRYQDFRAQLAIPKTFDARLFNDGIVLLLQGLFKKVALSDNLSILANTGYAASANIGTTEAWIASLAFTAQIYFDFSGYTDMGRGSAMMLGYSLPDNFNLPYIASSLSDFWKRWHISLSSWLRDYLYIPLGGGRCSTLKKYSNLMTTMLLGGLWHGAAWHFVAWGGLHGAGLVVNHAYDGVATKNQALSAFHQSAVGKLLSGALTFLFVVVGWVFFRAATTTEAWQILTAMFSYQTSSLLSEDLARTTLPSAFALYGVYFLLSHNWHLTALSWVSALRERFPLMMPARIAVYAAAVIAAVGFAPPESSAFIYFQF